MITTIAPRYGIYVDGDPLLKHKLNESARDADVVIVP